MSGEIELIRQQLEESWVDRAAVQAELDSMNAARALMREDA